MDPEQTPEEKMAALEAKMAELAALVATLIEKLEEKAEEKSEESAEEAPSEESESQDSEEEKKEDEEPSEDEKSEEKLDAKLDVIEKARLVLGKFDHKGKSVAQIQREVVEARSKVKLDGKSSDYVSARFDSLVETAQSAGNANRKIGGLQAPVKTPAQKMDAAETAREKMLASNRDAWKVK